MLPSRVERRGLKIVSFDLLGLAIVVLYLLRKLSKEAPPVLIDLIRGARIVYDEIKKPKHRTRDRGPGIRKFG